jgi:hypothetical protein
LNIVHFLCAKCGCREEQYRHLPSDIAEAYRLWYDPVDFVRLLLGLGTDAAELRALACNLILPFPRATLSPGFSDSATAIDAWQLARNWLWEHALMEILRIHYPIEFVASKMLEALR